MFNLHLCRYLLTLLTIVLIAGCSRPDTPLDVASHFWKAVVSGDTRQAVRYSTLTSNAAFDAFGRGWTAEPELSRVVIEGQRAHVAARLPDRAFTTYLIYQNEQWLVDYERTRSSLSPSSAIDQLFQTFSQVGREVTRQLEQSSLSLLDQVDSLTEVWQARSGPAVETFEQQLEVYSAQLKSTLDELNMSINQALQRHQDAPEEVRRKLGEAADALAKSSEALAEPGLTAIREASQTLIETSRELADISDGSVRELKQQWQRQLDALAEQTRRFRAQSAEPQDPS